MNLDECVAAGIDPKKVRRYQIRLEKLLAEMKSDNIMVFGGGDGSSLRPHRGDLSTQLLILAHINAGNLGGGAGAYCAGWSDDGLLRGEA